jgi:hypothetical protein
LVSKSPAGRAREETVFGSHPLLTSGALGFKAQCSVRLESTNSPLRRQSRLSIYPLLASQSCITIARR